MMVHQPATAFARLSPRGKSNVPSVLLPRFAETCAVDDVLRPGNIFQVGWTIWGSEFLFRGAQHLMSRDRPCRGCTVNRRLFGQDSGFPMANLDSWNTNI
jgi:hypothetical protein